VVCGLKDVHTNPVDLEYYELSSTTVVCGLRAVHTRLVNIDTTGPSSTMVMSIQRPS